MSQPSSPKSPTTSPRSTSRLSLNMEEARRNIDKIQQIFDEARASRVAELKKHKAQVDRRNAMAGGAIMFAVLWIGLRMLTLYVHGGPLVSDLEVFFMAVVIVFISLAGHIL